MKSTKRRTRSFTGVRKARKEEFFDDDEFLSTAYRRDILTVACMVAKFGYERRITTEHAFASYKLPAQPEQPYDYWRLEDEDAFLGWLEKGGPRSVRVAIRDSTRSGQKKYRMRPFKMRPGKAEELHDIVLFALRSGLRKGEIGALRPRDVNFEKNVIVVRRSYSEKEKVVKQTTKSKNYRFVEMNGDMREILKKRIAHAVSDEARLFNSSAWAVKKFSSYCEKAGVRVIHFHSLRHTCLTNLANGYGLDAPIPLPQVQKIAGHRDVATTMRYVHTNGIENTSSRQLSRAERKAAKLQERKRELSPNVAYLDAHR
ncbi:MAG: site-specific integrase [Pseudobacteriovorax sp.]|nr:site-specific integrase [Pseudobacteriovorax sp.]